MARRRNGRNQSDFARAFMGLSENIKAAAKAALEEGAKIVVADAKSLCPDKTGKLRGSIQAKPNRNGTRIKITAPATNEKSGIAYGQYVEFWPGREHPFLYPAMDANRERVKEMIRKAMKQGD